MKFNLTFIKKEMKGIASFLAAALILNPVLFADSPSLLTGNPAPTAVIDPLKAAEKNAAENPKSSVAKSETTSDFLMSSGFSPATAEKIPFITAKRNVPVTLGSLQITLRVADSNGAHSVDISKINSDSSLTFVKNILLTNRPEAPIQVGYYKTPEGRETLLLNYQVYTAGGPFEYETKIVDGLTGNELPVIRGEIETAVITDGKQLELSVKMASKPWPQEVTTVDLVNFKVLSTLPENLDVTKFSPAASNSHFGFLGVGDGPNTDLWLIDFDAYAKTGELPIIIGGGSNVRHAVIGRDVSPNGETVIVFYHESGADYLNGSGFSIQRMSDIKQGNLRHAAGKSQVHPQNISFDAVTGKAVIMTQERNDRQVLNIWDPVVGKLINVELHLLTKDKVAITPGFVAGHPDLIQLTYSSGEIAYFDAKTGKSTFPPNPVQTASNPDFYYAKRNATASTPLVYYDIFSKDGTKVFSVIADTPNIQGNFSRAVSVPDISTDGKYLILGKLTQLFFTGHKLQTLSVEIYNMQTRKLEAPSIKLVETDNKDIAGSDIPTEIRFVPGSNFLIQAVFKQGLYQKTTEKHDIRTRKMTQRTVSTFDAQNHPMAVTVVDYQSDGKTLAQLSVSAFNTATGKLTSWSGEFFDVAGRKTKSLVYVYYIDGVTVAEFTQSLFNSTTGNLITKTVVSRNLKGQMTGWILTENFPNGIDYDGQKMYSRVVEYRVNPETGKQTNFYTSYYSKTNIRLSYIGLTYQPDGVTVAQSYQVKYGPTGLRMSETYGYFDSLGRLTRTWFASYYPDGKSKSKIIDLKYDPVTGKKLSEVTNCYALTGATMVCAA